MSTHYFSVFSFDCVSFYSITNVILIWRRRQKVIERNSIEWCFCFITQISTHADNKLIINEMWGPFEAEIHSPKFWPRKFSIAFQVFFDKHVQRGREVLSSHFSYSLDSKWKIIEARFRGFTSFGGFEMVCCRARLDSNVVCRLSFLSIPPCIFGSDEMFSTTRLRTSHIIERIEILFKKLTGVKDREKIIGIIAREIKLSASSLS